MNEVPGASIISNVWVQAGALGILIGWAAYSWYSERQERRAAQADAIAMGKDAIKANIEGANVIEALTKRIEDFMRGPAR